MFDDESCIPPEIPIDNRPFPMGMNRPGLLRATLLGFGCLIFGNAQESFGQVLAPHPPMRILILSDEVNPHGLPPQDLTQPGEISATLQGLSGLQLEGPEALVEIDTDSIENATDLLQRPAEDPTAYDVLIYFAHRIPNGGDGVMRQEAFVSALTKFLTDGGSVVSFHHGIYRTNGKQSMQELLGGEATGNVPWNVVDGQNVINVAPDHFVTGYGVDYEGLVSYEDPSVGVPSDDYAFFNNTPDERYPFFSFLPTVGDIEPLFASDYAQNGSTHVLGYVHTRPQWQGIVMVYQPGEYQPNALGPGSNLQVLLNMIVFAAREGSHDWLFGDGFESGNTNAWNN